jgi:hypothetical protein
MFKSKQKIGTRILEMILIKNLNSVIFIHVFPLRLKTSEVKHFFSKKIYVRDHKRNSFKTDREILSL